MDDGVMPLSEAGSRPFETEAQGSLVLNPVGGGGGGSANTFPIILGGSQAMVGLVLANSAVAIKLFKIMAVTGETDFDFEEKMRDEAVMAKVRDLLTTDDFAEGSPFDFRENGYLDLYTTLYNLWDAYNEVLAAYNSSDRHAGPDAKGVVSICVNGSYAVRPTWSKRTADAVGESGDDAVDYALTRLDFGTEAQLSTWDGSKYLCDYDDQGNVRETPVVKRVYVSRCPNEAKEGS